MRYRKRCDDGISQKDAMLLALKMGGGAMSQGIWAASRRWKKQGNRLFPQNLQKEHSPVDVGFSPMKPVSDF